MNTCRYLRACLAALSLTLMFGAAPVSGQEGFKGGGTVFTRTAKKVHTAKRPAAARISPQAIEANERGDFYFNEGRYEEAIASYQRAIKLYPRYEEAYLGLGDAYKELKRYEEAVGAYKQAIKLKPNYADAFNGLGDVYEALGRQTEADAAHDKAKTSYTSGGLLNGKAIKLVTPSYPAIARAARASGLVVVEVLVDETGQVIRARALSGQPLLVAAAVKAASESVFSPTLLSGQPVKVTGTINYNFSAQ